MNLSIFLSLSLFLIYLFLPHGAGASVEIIHGRHVEASANRFSLHGTPSTSTEKHRDPPPLRERHSTRMSTLEKMVDHVFNIAYQLTGAGAGQLAQERGTMMKYDQIKYDVDSMPRITTTTDPDISQLAALWAEHGVNFEHRYKRLRQRGNSFSASQSSKLRDLLYELINWLELIPSWIQHTVKDFSKRLRMLRNQATYFDREVLGLASSASF
ncbi:MAG: hypothetical protein DHS80DRAFT_24336 [Piptocephalis tieghemiana]|nr:MAG: hypothetical protein DHS80DRAFT_24336 [Piptocephalis tieghemiana]